MGLYSDILEACKDNPLNGYDQTAVWYVKPKASERYINDNATVKQAIKQRTINFSTIYVSEEDVRKREQELFENINELENIRYRYNLVEKCVRQLLDDDNIESLLMRNVFESIIAQSEEMDDYISSVKHDIKWSKKDSIRYELEEIDEDALKRQLVQMIFINVDISFRNGLEMDRVMFKQLVKDLGYLLDKWDPKDKKIAYKQKVENYFINVCDDISSQVTCQNCGHSLLQYIPYCFKCFDGRFSGND